jgi:tetratricopeptide (TPR) repeat protein
MMVSKTLIHKEVHNITSQKDIPDLSVEKIAQIISSNPKALSTYSKYELDRFHVKFMDVMEGTRKDLTLHYSIKGAKTVYKDPAEFEGIKYYDTISYEESENTTLKVDYVSFFTKPKDNINEHRIYQIGPRYSNKEKRTLETLLRKNEKERDIVATINTLRKILKISPNEYKKWNRLGKLFVKTKQYDNAIEACKRAIGLVGIFSPAWICLGMAYYGKGNTEKAKKFIKKTLDDDPRYSNYGKK